MNSKGTWKFSVFSACLCPLAMDMEKGMYLQECFPQCFGCNSKDLREQIFTLCLCFMLTVGAESYSVFSLKIKVGKATINVTLPVILSGEKG